MLEIGPGLGVLTAYLADRIAHVHAVELDRSLEPRLREALEGRDNVELHFGDALRLDLAALEPAPTKLVSNLPYNIATPLVVESLDGLPSVELWCVMVQREVADRFFAEPSTKAYGAVSVLVQLAAERTGFHPVSRTVFRPRPNVDSALVAFRRRELPPDFARVKRLVDAAFAHRRKRLANSLELAGVATRDEAAEALRGDRPRAGRARRGARAARVRRPRGRAGRVNRAPATAKLNLALVVGPLRDDGRHEVVTVLQRIDLADRVAIEPAAGASRRGLRRRHARPPRARAPRRGCGRRAALARADLEAHPGRRRPRRRQLRRRDRAEARQRDPARAAPARAPARARGGARRGRAVLPHLGPAARRRARARARAARAAAGLLGRPAPARRASTSRRPPPSTRTSTAATAPRASRSGARACTKRSPR